MAVPGSAARSCGQAASSARGAGQYGEGEVAVSRTLSDAGPVQHQSQGLLASASGWLRG
jgi:hypothetical protein